MTPDTTSPEASLRRIAALEREAAERLRDGRIPNPPVANPPVPPPSANGWHDTPLASLDLPPQSLHALQVAGMETVGQLVDEPTTDDIAARLVEVGHLGKRAARVAAQVVTEYMQAHGGGGDGR